MRDPKGSELVIITGLSGSGKATVLKALEDLGYYAVDNLPIGLLPKFAELAKDSLHVRRAALVIDIREGQKLVQFPAIFRRMRRQAPATLLFLEADDRTLVRRFSETRRPHPLGLGDSVIQNIRTERKRLAAHPRRCRSRHQHLEVQCPRAPRCRRGQVRRRARTSQYPHRHHQFRLPAWRAGRQRSGF